MRSSSFGSSARDVDMGAAMRTSAISNVDTHAGPRRRPPDCRRIEVRGAAFRSSPTNLLSLITYERTLVGAMSNCQTPNHDLGRALFDDRRVVRGAGGRGCGGYAGGAVGSSNALVHVLALTDLRRTDRAERRLDCLRRSGRFQ